MTAPTAFQVTLLEQTSLPERLCGELACFARLTRNEGEAFLDHPREYLQLRKTAALHALLHWRLAALTACAIVLTLLLAVALTNRPKKLPVPDHEIEYASVISFDAPLLSADGKSSVGLNDGAGQGSATQIRKSSGGGGGGNRNPNPAQTGAVPPPADIPAPIDNLTRKNPALPLAGIKLDPVLWKPMPLAQYGDPRSTSLTQSNGPGTEGGIGNGSGQGIGEGDGPGLGPGEKGNTGGGLMESGWGRSGGNSCATRICVGNNRVFPSREVEERARVLFKPEPQYTEEARRNQISGTVTLRVVFSRAGEVTDIRALHALPFGLTERAIAAARQIRFVPAKRGGQAVSVFMQLEYNFNLY